jgi:hypothetical protein
LTSELNKLSISSIRRLDLLQPSDEIIQGGVNLITFLEKDSKAQKIRKKRKSDSANPNAKKSAPEKEQEPDLEPEGPIIQEQLEEKRVLMKQLMNEQRQLATRIELERIEYNTLRKELADAPQCDEADEFSGGGNGINRRAVLMVINGKPAVLMLAPGEFLFYEDIKQAIIVPVSDKNVLYSCGEKVYALYYYGNFACWAPKGA